MDIPDDCPLTLPTNPSLYRQLVQYFRQYFGTRQVEVGEETEEETISFTPRPNNFGTPQVEAGEETEEEIISFTPRPNNFGTLQVEVGEETEEEIIHTLA